MVHTDINTCMRIDFKGKRTVSSLILTEGLLGEVCNNVLILRGRERKGEKERERETEGGRS